MPWNQYNGHWTGTRPWFHPKWLLEAINGRTWTINGANLNMALLKSPPTSTPISPDPYYAWWSWLDEYAAIQPHEVQVKEGYDYAPGQSFPGLNAGIDTEWPYSRLLLASTVRWERLNDPLYALVLYEDDTVDKKIACWLPFSVSNYYWSSWSHVNWAPPVLAFNQPFEIQFEAEGVFRWYGGPLENVPINPIYPSCMTMAMAQPDWETAKISLMDTTFGFFPLDHDTWGDISGQAVPDTDELVGYRSGVYQDPPVPNPGEGCEVFYSYLNDWYQGWGRMYLGQRGQRYDNGNGVEWLTNSYGPITANVGGAVLYTDNSLISGIEFPQVTLVDEYITVSFHMTINLFTEYPNPPDP